MMVGRRVENLFPHVDATVGEERLVVRNVSDGGRLKNASLTIRAGEVVGLVGLMGSGRTELIRCIAGLSAPVTGTIRVLGQERGGHTVSDLIRLGVAYIPEDRFFEGVYPEMSVADNLTLLWDRAHNSFGMLRAGQARAVAGEAISELAIRPAMPRRMVRFLSGGNQQKVVLGRSLQVAPKLVLLDDPTRGVDVGSKAELHALVARMKVLGAAILLTSSEMPEVLAVADRVVVMRRGETVAEHARGVTEMQVMHDAFGQHPDAPASSQGPAIAEFIATAAAAGGDQI